MMIRRQSGYCKIIGNLSSSNSIQSINIHHIQPVLSYNEVIEHFLNVILSNHFYKNKQQNVSFLKSYSIKMSDVSKSEAVTSSSPNEFSNAVEMFVARELQQSLKQNPTGVHISVLASALASYGISLDQLKYY